VLRWSKDDKKKVPVEQPHVYETYNSYMGGVDNVDQNLNAYRIVIKGKKWWWVIFTYLIDLCMVNA
jgi:N-glycosylase/DNA lyase